jgi:hypothetical protein
MNLDDRVFLTQSGLEALQEHRRTRAACLAWLRGITSSDQYPMRISVMAAEIRKALETGKPASESSLRWLERQCHSGDAIRRRWAQHALDAIRETEG